MAVRATLAANPALLLAVGITLVQCVSVGGGQQPRARDRGGVKLGKAGGRSCQDGDTIPGDAATLPL